MKKIFIIALALGLFLGFSCTENEAIDLANTDDQTSKVDDEATTEEEEAEIDSSMCDGLWSDPVLFTSYELTFGAEGGTLTTTAQLNEFCEWWLGNVCLITDKEGVNQRCFIYNEAYFTEDTNYETTILAVGTYGALIDAIPEDERDPVPTCCDDCSGVCYKQYQLLNITYDGFFKMTKTTPRDLVFTLEPNTSNVVKEATFYFTAGDYGNSIHITQEAAE